MSFLDKEFNNFDGNYLKLLDYISEIDVRISKLENSKSRENLQNECSGQAKWEHYDPKKLNLA